MLRFFFSLIGICIIAIAAFFVYEHKETILQQIEGLKKEPHVNSLEASLSPDEIVQLKQQELLRDPGSSIAETQTVYLPYLLFDVKFVNSDKKTEEGRLLFSMVTGEMVLDTQTFSTTHGFEDCIEASASAEDFKVLHLLDANGGHMTRELLAQKLALDPEELGGILESLRKKHLIAVKGDTVRIHFQNPILNVVPKTKFAHPLVLKEVTSRQRLSPQFSKNQVKKIVKAAFGQDFAIRKESELYIPVIEVDVLMKDGSIFKTFWNGITGKRFEVSPRV